MGEKERKNVCVCVYKLLNENCSHGRVPREFSSSAGHCSVNRECGECEEENSVGSECECVC